MNKFFNLSKQIFQNKKELIQKLEEDQYIQLDYIKLLIKSSIKNGEFEEEENEEIKNILILHINLLCKLKKFDEIVPALKYCSFYPFEECLSICEKYNAYEALIYLYIRAGGIDKAFNLSMIKTDEFFNKILENINNENNNEEHKKLLKEFDRYLIDARNTCENKYINLEDLWFKLLDKIYKYEVEAGNLVKKNENDDKKKINSEELHQTILKDIKELIEKMCSYVGIKRILEAISDKNKNYGFSEYRDLILKLLDAYSNSTNILFSTRNLLCDSVFETEHSFQEYNLKGELLKEKCDKCHKEFDTDIYNKGKAYLFKCKHIFHKECIIINNTERGIEGICPLCQNFYVEEKKIEGISLIKDNSNIIKEKRKRNKKESSLLNKVTQKFEKFENRYMEKHTLMVRRFAKLYDQ